MPEFLVLLLMQVTIFSSVTAIILIAVKQIFKCRIPPRIGVVLWIILAARLFCPIFPESEISVYNFIPVGRNIMFTLTNNVNDELSAKEELKLEANNPYVIHRKGENDSTAEEITSGTENDAVTVGDYFAEAVGESESAEVIESTARRINTAIITVYFVGIAVSFITSCAVYIKAKNRALSSSEPCTNDALLSVYSSTADHLGIRADKRPPLRCGVSPMLIGCRNAQIVCREDMDRKEAEMVFTHELLHYKCLDNSILLFSTAVACLFWYNPLIWIVRNILREDLEVLCDARTLESCSIPRTEYAMMLFRSSAYSELIGAGCHMSASGRRLRNRLRTISSGKHKRFLPRFASSVLCGVIVMLCLTNPIVSQNSDYSVFIENYAELTGGNVRAMHLYSQETVSSYLNQISVLLREWYGDDYSADMGNGNLEKFKRICSASDRFDRDTKSAVMLLRTDEPLTNRSCAVIGYCVSKLIGTEIEEEGYSILPDKITAADMEKMLQYLSEAETEALMKCYNRGVAGADASFEMFYSEAMMELILSRISDEWTRAKFEGFYAEYDLASLDKTAFSNAFLEVIKTFDKAESVYLCDFNITKVEKQILSDILDAAYAGENEDVYYLKKTEDGCTYDTAKRIIKRGRLTYEDMLLGYAKIGEPGEYTGSGGFGFVRFRDEDIAIAGSNKKAIRDAVKNAYSLGLIDASEDGVIDITEKLSYGQGIAYAYRLVSAMVPVN